VSVTIDAKSKPHRNTLQQRATRYKTPQNTATRYKTPQNTATRYNTQ